MFNVDFRKALYNLIPHFLRGEKNLAWLYSLQQPLKALNGVFVSFRNNINYRLQFTAQIIYLEHYLNDQFDQATRGIFIDNIEQVDFKFIFNNVELKPAIYLYNNSEAQPPVYFYQYTELLEGDTYIINVPVAVAFDELVMRSKVDFYNNAGKNYSIVTY